MFQIDELTKEKTISSDEENSENQDENIMPKRPLLKNIEFSFKIRNWLSKIFAFLLNTKTIKEDPFDTLIMKAHYVFASQVAFVLFIFSTTFWNAEKPIICVDQSDRSTPPDTIIEYCLNYPYTEYEFGIREIKRQYALHYRWVHLVFLFISIIYKGVFILKIMFCNKNLRNMLEELNDANKPAFYIIKEYYLNKGMHCNMYTKYIFVHICTLGVNIFAFTMINIALQNQYWDLPKNLAIKRDPATFDDAYSLIFPPFVQCEVTPDHHIMIERVKRYGCHLTWMEVYEKIFMIFWFFQVFLALWTFLFIIINFPLPCFKKWRIKLLTSGFYENFKPFTTCSIKFTYHELFAIGCIQHLVGETAYIKLLKEMEKKLDDNNEDSLSKYEDDDDSSFDKSKLFQFYSSNEDDSFEHSKAHLGFCNSEKIYKYSPGRTRKRFSTSFDDVSNNDKYLGFGTPLSDERNSTYYKNEDELMNNLQLSSGKKKLKYSKGKSSEIGILKDNIISSDSQKK